MKKIYLFVSLCSLTSINSFAQSCPTMTSANSATICSGDVVSISLTAAPSGATITYTWEASDNPNTSGESTTSQSTSTLSNTIINTTASVQTVTYTVTPSSNAGTCVGTPQTVNVTVNPDATISLTSVVGSDAQSLCINTAIVDITYSVTDGGTGASVTGLPAGVTGAFAAGVVTISGTPSVTGTYNYTVTTTGTCVQTSATGSMIVDPDATISLTSAVGTDAQSLCINTAIVDITYSVTDGGTGASVTGLPAGVSGAFSAGVVTISGTPSVAGTFNYTATTTGTCVQTTATGSMIVNPDAAISLTSAVGSDAQSLCSNIAITNITYSVTDDGTGASVTGLPAGVTGAFAAGVVTISGTPSVTGTFNYTVTTTGTCVQTSATGSIIVNPDAAISLTSAVGTDAQSLCSNIAITNITYSVTDGGTGASVTGLPAGVTGAFAAGVVTISGITSVVGTFNYTVTTTGTCVQTSATGSMIVNPDAAISLTSAVGTDALSLCINTAIVNITYSVTDGGTGASVTGLPAGVTGAFSGGVVTISGTPSVAGTFNYTVTTTGTCVQTKATGSITVPLPTATIVVTNSDLANSVKLTASSSNSYLWSNNATTQSINVSSSGNYSVTVTNVNGCSAASTITTVTFIPSAISAQGTKLTSGSATGNEWYKDGTPIPGATSQEYTATQNGSYTVKVTDGNGISITSPPFNINTIVGIVENNFSSTISIYPNPFTFQTSISFSEEQYNTIIKIMNLSGKEIKNINFSGKQLIIEKEEMQEGIYFVQIMDRNKNVLNRKIVVE